MQTPLDQAPRWRIALVVIARDEATRISRLLASVRPWVDEMVVLDTGSADGTAARARAAGARVGHFKWVDDFSAARNAALDLAAADWHLVLDADEWLAEGGPFLAALRAQAPGFAGRLRLESLTGADGATRGVSHLTRLLPGTVRYEGRVHEQPVHRLPVQAIPLSVQHDGYLPDALAAKKGRNRRLLLQAVTDAPLDAYLWYQLGQDASVYEEHADAEAGLARACTLARGDEPWFTDLVVRRLHGLTRLGAHERALELALTMEAICQGSPDFHFACGSLFLDWTSRAPQRAVELLQQAEHCWRTCLALGEHPELDGAVLGRGSTLAAFNLALVLEGTGRPDEARALREQFELDSRPALR